MRQPRTGDPERVDILDERGRSVGQVVRPTDPRPLGSAKGTIYLQRIPIRDGPEDSPRRSEPVHLGD
jgi:hypothetical protein